MLPERVQVKHPPTLSSIASVTLTASNPTDATTLTSLLIVPPMLERTLSRKPEPVERQFTPSQQQ